MSLSNCELMNNYYVYILRCSDKSYYVGVTNDVEKRYEEHMKGDDISAYTYRRKPLQLVYNEEFDDIAQAIEREKQIKGWSRAKKEALIKSDWNKLIALSKNYTQYPRHGSTSSP